MDKKKAVALKYQPKKDNAPKVVAKGQGKLAEKIIQIAKEHNIPIKEDKDTVEILSSLDIGEEIPPELYEVIAEILAYIYKTKNKIH